MIIHTFNVLHRCHEEYYNKDNSFIIKKFINENDRINEIYVKIIELLIDELVIINLQEVPHDLLIQFYILRQNTQFKYLQIYYYKIPRYPKSNYFIYSNNSEYIVTLIWNKNINNYQNQYIDFIQYTDFGKASLITQIDTHNIIIINTHLPIDNYGGKDAFQCIKEYIDNYDTDKYTFIVIGDFNKNKNYMFKEFEKHYMFQLLKTYTKTEDYTYKRKINNNTSIYKSYDHIFIFSKKNYDLININIIDEELSDHSLVSSKLIEY